MKNFSDFAESEQASTLGKRRTRLGERWESAENFPCGEQHQNFANSFSSF